MIRGVFLGEVASELGPEGTGALGLAERRREAARAGSGGLGRFFWGHRGKGREEM